MAVDQNILVELAEELASSISTGNKLFEKCAAKTDDPRNLFVCDVTNYTAPSNDLVDVFLEEKPDLISSFLTTAKDKGMPFSKDQLEQMICHILLHGEGAIKRHEGSAVEVRKFEKSFQTAAVLQSYLRINYNALSPQDIAGFYQKYCPEAWRKSPHYRPNILEGIIDQSIKSDFLNSKDLKGFFDAPFTEQDFLAREETLNLIIKNGYFDKINQYLKGCEQPPIHFAPILQGKIKEWITNAESTGHVITFLNKSDQPVTVQFLRDGVDCPNEPLSQVIKKVFETEGQDREMFAKKNREDSYDKQMLFLLKAFTVNGDSIDLDDFYFGINSVYFGRDLYVHTDEKNRPLLRMLGGAGKILKDDDCLIQLTRDPNAILFLQKVWETVPEDQREALQDTYTKAFNSAFAAQALRQREMFSASSR
jgi:hypothetical protein